MDQQPALHLQQFIATTDRGTLWVATRQHPGDRIVRLVEARFSDHDFRQVVRSLREIQYPRVLRVVGEGWSGDHYYLEYVLDAPWETLEAHFQRLHWRLRLAVVHEICEVISQWHRCPARPLGLNGRNIIMLRTAGRWFPWLLPAPPLKYASPCDLFGCDPPVLTALAPEIIRGVPFDARVQNSYALGHLILRALGCREAPPMLSDAECIEAQARGALLVGELRVSEVEEFMRHATALEQLMQVVRHYTESKPDARPVSATELQEACAQAITATDPLQLAADLVKRGRWHEALRWLEWGRALFGESVEGDVLAADIYEKIDDVPQALAYLDHAMHLLIRASRSTPNAIDRIKQLRQRRCTLRWAMYQHLPSLAPGEPDPQGDLLLEDLEVLKHLVVDVYERNRPYLQAAHIYRRRHDLYRAAYELHQAADLEAADLLALFLYGECLRDLGEWQAVAQVRQLAQDRLRGMVASQMMGEREAHEWRERFNTLSGP